MKRSSFRSWCAGLGLALFFTQNGWAAEGPPATTAPAPDDLTTLSLQELLQVSVTASLKEQTTSDAPASIVVITARDIRLRGYRTIKDILMDIPGFNDISDANEEIAATRGMFASTTNKLLTLLNGHRMNDVQLGRYNLDQFVGLDAVERVEIIRGPGSALYGTGALSGVINIITKSTGTLDGTEAHVRAGAHGSQSSLSYGGKHGDLELFSNFTFLDQSGHEIEQPASLDVSPQKKGVVYDHKYPRNWSGLVTAKTKHAELMLRGSHAERAAPRAANGGFYDFDDEPFKPTYELDDFLIDLKYDIELTERSKLTLRPSLHYYYLTEMSFMNGADASDNPPYGTRNGQKSSYRQTQIKAVYENQVRDNVNVIVGLDSLFAEFLRGDSYSINGATTTILPNGAQSKGVWHLAGVFAQAIWSPFDKLTFTLGGRYDTFQDQAAPDFNPRVAAVYRPTSETYVKALWAQSYMAPEWVHTESSNPSFQGNRDLEPEQIEGFDLIVGYEKPKDLALELGIFYDTAENFISRPAGEVKYLNSGKMNYYGAELSAKVFVTPRHQILASFSMVKAGDETSIENLQDDQIKSVPQETARLGIVSNLIDPLTLSFFARATTQVNTTDAIRAPGETYQVPVQVLADFVATYELKDWQFQAIVNNVFDDEYELAGTATRPMPRAGIAGELGVSYRF